MDATDDNKPRGADADAAAVRAAQASTDAAAEPKRIGGVRIRVLNTILIVLASFVSLMFLQAVQQTNQAYNELETASERYVESVMAANEMKDASSYLTRRVRNYVVTGNEEYLDAYFEEIEVTKRRDHALETLASALNKAGSYHYLEQARKLSEQLCVTEYYALALMADAEGVSVDGYAAMRDVHLTAEDAALSASEKRERASELVFEADYLEKVDQIEKNVILCREELVNEFEEVRENSSETLRGLLFRQQLLTWALLAVVILLILSFIVVLLWPLQHYITRIKSNDPLPEAGAYELRYLAREYNVMYEENLRNHEQLRRRAEHDHLTGLFNRSVFEKLLYAYREESIALLLIDADHFKDINDTLGHDGGDAMLQKIARSLTDTFRHTDYPCRIGGDEFAVIMTEMDASLKGVVEARVKAVTEILCDTSDGLPVMTLSIGVAFSGSGMDAEELFKHADDALYDVKEAGRNGLGFYGA